jgi:hypothetical protein
MLSVMNRPVDAFLAPLFFGQTRHRPSIISTNLENKQPENGSGHPWCPIEMIQQRGPWPLIGNLPSKSNGSPE